jgi:hypothetical protein
VNFGFTIEKRNYGGGTVQKPAAMRQSFRGLSASKEVETDVLASGSVRQAEYTALHQQEQTRGSKAAARTAFGDCFEKRVPLLW